MPQSSRGKAPGDPLPDGDGHRLERGLLVGGALVVVVGLTAGLMAFAVHQIGELGRAPGDSVPENSLPLLLVAGTVVLLVSITGLVVVAARLGLANRESPLGLPEGSIRAIIALLLIVLFFITAVFLYADAGRDGETRTLRGIDADRLAEIPTDDLKSVEPVTGATDRFNVVLRSVKPQASTDLAKQLATTVSTLVVAISAFYFGANAVQSATRDPADPSGPSGGNGPGTGPTSGGQRASRQTFSGRARAG